MSTFFYISCFLIGLILGLVIWVYKRRKKKRNGQSGEDEVKQESRYHRLNEAIYRGQCRIGWIVETYFTFAFAMIFFMAVGAVSAFIGSACDGKIPLNSPIAYGITFLTAIVCFQIYISMQLTIWRIIRLLTVGSSTHLLTYQAYGFYSMANTNVTEGYRCFPYAQATIKQTYFGMITGDFLIHVPVAILMLLCIFVWNKATGELTFSKDHDIEGQK